MSNLVIDAFLAGQRKTSGNDHTDGTCLYYHGNKIAIMEGGELYITTSGWHTTSTLRRLNMLPGVGVRKKDGQLYLNGYLWDGTSIRVSKIGPASLQVPYAKTSYAKAFSIIKDVADEKEEAQ